jgi:hypothetical protein
MTMHFVANAVIFVLLLSFRTKRRREIWVHPLISQRLLKGQLHKAYKDLRAYPPKIFSSLIINFCVKIVLFTAFSYCENTKKPVGKTQYSM